MTTATATKPRRRKAANTISRDEFANLYAQAMDRYYDRCRREAGNEPHTDKVSAHDVDGRRIENALRQQHPRHSLLNHGPRAGAGRVPRDEGQAAGPRQAGVSGAIQ